MLQDHPCDYCGAPACVHITHDFGNPGSTRHFCMGCADGREHDRSTASASHGILIVWAGISLLAISTLLDWLRFGQGSGLSPWQVGALVVALILTSYGSMSRIPSLAILGFGVMMVALACDYTGLNGLHGLGNRQSMGVLFAGTAIGVGVTVGSIIKSRGETQRIERGGVNLKGKSGS